MKSALFCLFENFLSPQSPQSLQSPQSQPCAFFCAMLEKDYNVKKLRKIDSPETFDRRFPNF